jgi:acyl-CoA thioester hydrolase
VATTFRLPLRVRYAECDQQGVVFNAHYLTWFDEAMTALLEARGLPYTDLLDRGVDVQLVHNETTWRRPVRWRDDVAVAASASRIGTTSFAVDFAVEVGEQRRVTGRTTYVVVGADRSGAQPVPPWLRGALEPLAPLHDG